MTTTKTQPNTNDLDAGRRAAYQELQDARAAHGRAAYAHALDRDNPDTRKAVLEAKRRMEVLSAELEGLEAAAREAKRLEDLSELSTSMASVKQVERDAEAAIDAIGPAFDRFHETLRAFADAMENLEATERAATTCLRRAYPEMRPFDTPRIFTTPAAEALMWLYLKRSFDLSRNALVMTGAGEPTPDGPAAALAKERSRHKERMRESCAAQREAIQEQAQRVEAMAA